MNTTTNPKAGGFGRVHVGLDVHKDTISVAIAWHRAVTGDLVVEDMGVVSNRPSQIKRCARGLSKI